MNEDTIGLSCYFPKMNVYDLYRTLPAKLQLLALRLYRNVLAQAFIRSSFGERVFFKAYFLYKWAYEAREVAQLRPYTKSDGWIIDVGANIGFFTVIFAGWLDKGKVLALEPEADNFRRLQAIVTSRKLGSRVETRQVAAAERKGPGHLIISHESHADHRLGADGDPITLDTLDSLWAEFGRPDVRLIKIDVQGAEYQVLSGAKKVLGACRPALYVEVDVSPDRVSMDSPKALLSMLEALGYKPHAWRKGWNPLTSELALIEVRKSASGYEDFLFLPKLSSGPN